MLKNFAFKSEAKHESFEFDKLVTTSNLKKTCIYKFVNSGL